MSRLHYEPMYRRSGHVWATQMPFSLCLLPLHATPTVYDDCHESGGSRSVQVLVTFTVQSKATTTGTVSANASYHSQLNLHVLQVPNTMLVSVLSTQLSMAPVQPETLLELQALGPDAKLSIFDDTFKEVDVSPAGVLAKVATAAKGWQKFKGLQATLAAEAPDSGSDSLKQKQACHSTEVASSTASSSQLQHANHPADEHKAAASSDGAVHNSSAAVISVKGSAGALLLPGGVSSSSADSSTGRLQPLHRVGFAGAAEVSSEGAGEGDRGSSMSHAVVQQGQAEQQVEQQATAAGLRMAAGMRR